MKINIKEILEGLNNTVFVKEEVEKVAKERHDICKVCPFNSKNTLDSVRPDEHCTVCACNIHLKVRSLSSDCPKGKWESLASEEDSDTIENAIKPNDD